MKSFRVGLFVGCMFLFTGCGAKKFTLIEPPTQPINSFSGSKVNEMKNAIPNYDAQPLKTRIEYPKIAMYVQKALQEGLVAIGFSGPAESKTLVVDGSIVELEPGNQTLRWLFGLGVGAGRISVNLKFKDANDQLVLSGIAEGKVYTGFTGGEITYAADQLVLAALKYLDKLKKSESEKAAR